MNFSSSELSRTFSRLMRECLTADELAQVNAMNKVGDLNICASHDFCDANQIMLDALSEYGAEFDSSSDEQARLIDSAWNESKVGGFAN